MNATPGNMLRELHAHYSSQHIENPVDEWDRGWNTCIHSAMKDLEIAISSVEGWELKNGH